MVTMVDTLQLSDGALLPALGAGLYKVDPADTERVTLAAIDAGYTLLDGAWFYANEAELGAAVRHSGRRDELLIASKYWGDPVQSYDDVFREFAESEAALDIGPVDIYMLHWPRTVRGTFVDAWRALIRLQEEGRVVSIGVANFGEDELTRLIEETGVAPVINQVESHPWLPQRALRAFHAQHGIVTQAWSPLGRGRLLEEPLLVDLAARLGVSVAQLVLRWHLQMGGAAVPKSTHAERLRENLAVDGFTLDEDAMAAIASLESGLRTGTDPKDRH